MKIWERPGVKALAERALKTFTQTFLATALVGGTILGVDWWLVFDAAVVAALLSVGTSLASWKVGGNRGPSLASEKPEGVLK